MLHLAWRLLRLKVKDRFKAAESSDVPLDYFLFSCHEAELTHRSVKKDNPVTWPSIDDIEPDMSDDGQLRDAIQDLLSWYAAQFPQLKSPEYINFGRLAEIADPIARLSIDVRTMVSKLTGTDFHIGESGENESNPRHNQIWDILQEFVSQIFRQHSGLYLKYMQWCYEAPKNEIIEPGSRPPVGRFAPPMRSRGGDRGPRPGGGDRPPRGDHQRGGDRGGGRHQGRRDGQQGGGGNNHHRNDRGPRHRGGGRDRDRGGDRPHDHARAQASAAGTEAAIAEVMEAVQRLREDANINEIPLRPANSFNRRLQHEQIKGSGFFSSSAGEGPSRAVVISRTDQGSGE